MEANQILTSDMLEILFEHRNKSYGAYELRRTYNKRITISLFITGGFILSISLLSLTAKSKEIVTKHHEKDSVTITHYKEEKVIDVKPLPREKETPKVTSKQFTTPKIVIDADVAVEETVPEIHELTNSRIDVIDVTGIEDEGIAIPNVDKQKGVIQPVTEPDPSPFVTVEVEASFKGDWKRYLEKNLNAAIPVQNGARPGSYTILIQFIVDVDGSISDVKALTSHGFGMEEEAVRVIKSAAKWEPAIQNGRKVKAYRKQPITFMVSDE